MEITILEIESGVIEIANEGSVVFKGTGKIKCDWDKMMAAKGGSEANYGAREFIEKNKNTAEIFEATWNSSRGVESGKIQIIIRSGGKQVQ
ncbi:hypothetical protein [Anaeromicropila populeti]|uniref:Uncharacterized protein n=1 Tax=Anaeromicropila populeti TaxID=37658 RepID=A0A1I6IS09_9FIRM|nr:hypothetical protein [Anaeromicropila populeti]SFR69513.1 hypothetical protein SAMN05661086_01107 [Anaeromicropila populeti]